MGCVKKSQSLLEPTNICKNGNYGVKFFGTEPIISLLYGHFFHQLNLMSCLVWKHSVESHCHGIWGTWTNCFLLVSFLSLFLVSDNFAVSIPSPLPVTTSLESFPVFCLLWGFALRQAFPLCCCTKCDRSMLNLHHINVKILLFVFFT